MFGVIDENGERDKSGMVDQLISSLLVLAPSGRTAKMVIRKKTRTSFPTTRFVIWSSGQRPCRTASKTGKNSG